MWKRMELVMIWIREITDGKSSTRMYFASRRIRASCVPCWGSGRSFWLWQQVTDCIFETCRWIEYRSILILWFSLLVALGIIVMALLGMFNVHRHGAINSAAIVLYALTSCVSGYCSCSFYTQIQGQRWVWNIILTSALFSGETHQSSVWIVYL